MARAIFHGQRGEIRQRYREGQEDQLGALGQEGDPAQRVKPRCAGSKEQPISQWLWMGMTAAAEQETSWEEATTGPDRGWAELKTTAERGRLAAMVVVLGGDSLGSALLAGRDVGPAQHRLIAACVLSVAAQRPAP